MLMAVCGIIAAFGMFLLTNAYRSAKASLVTVFEYTGMIWGPLWGYLFFSEIPSWSTATGMALIIAAGIFAVRIAAGQPAEPEARTYLIRSQLARLRRAGAAPEPWWRGPRPHPH